MSGGLPLSIVDTRREDRRKPVLFDYFPGNASTVLFKPSTSQNRIVIDLGPQSLVILMLWSVQFES